MEKKPWKQPRLRYWLHFPPYFRENRPDFMSNHKTKCFSSLHPSPWKMIPSLIFTDLTKSYNRSCFNFIFSHQLHSRERFDFMVRLCHMVCAYIYVDGLGLFILRPVTFDEVPSVCSGTTYPVLNCTVSSALSFATSPCSVSSIRWLKVMKGAFESLKATQLQTHLILLMSWSGLLKRGMSYCGKHFSVQSN